MDKRDTLRQNSPIVASQKLNLETHRKDFSTISQASCKLGTNLSKLHLPILYNKRLITTFLLPVPEKIPVAYHEIHTLRLNTCKNCIQMSVSIVRTDVVNQKLGLNGPSPKVIVQRCHMFPFSSIIYLFELCPKRRHRSTIESALPVSKSRKLNSTV